MKTGIVKDWRYMEHDMGAFHVENPKRIEAIYRMVEKDISFPYTEIEPRPAKEKEIQMVHASSYVNAIKETSGKGRMQLDPDTATSARSYEVALLAAGGLLKAIDLVMSGKIQNGFAIVRPPGHHAEASRAMGFCLFNNVAVGAEYLVNKHGIKRILVIDWDLHHGNGTQHSFYNRSDVLYFSTHQFPYYPGTGYWDEIGQDKGKGFTVNVPLSGGKTDEDYLFIFRKILAPIASDFKPEFILVSAGFDIYKADPLGGMQISEDGFGALTAELMSVAHKFSKDRILFTLEGGYDLQGLSEGVKQVLLYLGGEGKKPEIGEDISPITEKELAPVFDTQKQFWKL
ncbi:Histone deacetylase-like amidohydrolase [subsurface metagenome]|nr:histone deacetylase [bacterium]